MKKEKQTKENIQDDKEGVVVSKTKIDLIKKLLANIKESSERVEQLLFGLGVEGEDEINLSQMTDPAFEEEGGESGRVIEGVFDGEQMIGPDGRQYSMPANYASKSKLVEGDILKLTITDKGTFVYKQISPVDRVRVVGEIEKTPEGFRVVADGKKWKVLTASVTYFKGKEGDEAVILVPKAGDSNWAAVENVVRK